MKKGLKLIAGLLSTFISAPIWYFLLYTLLQAAHVDRLTWFLFWAYVPSTVIISILTVVVAAVLEN